MNLLERPIVCQITGAGRSAVAVIGLAGPGSRQRLETLFRSAGAAPLKRGQIRFGQWNQESLIVSPISDEHFEIHPHGGSAAVRAVMDDLIATGVRRVTPEQWALATKASVETLVLEASTVLPKCLTLDGASRVLDQIRGALLNWTIDWLDRFAALPTDSSRLEEFQVDAKRLSASGRYGLSLTKPRVVVFAGPPNVGKSSLVNRIVGYQSSITHDDAGTTRDVLRCDAVIDGIAMVLTDTAGIRLAQGVIEREGIRRAHEVIASADLVVLVTSPEMSDDDLSWQTSFPKLPCPTMKVVNKADRLSKGPLSKGPLSKGPSLFDGLATIATSNDSQRNGIEALMSRIVTSLSTHAPAPGQPMPICERQQAWIEKCAIAKNVPDGIASLQGLRSGEPLP